MLTLIDFRNVDDGNDPCPVGLLGGGEHFNDIPEGRCGENHRSQRLAARQMTSNNCNNIINNSITIPHNNMLQHVVTCYCERYTPSTSIYH